MDGDGICNAFEVLGCTDPNALNFDPEATDDNGLCNLPIYGCMDSGAVNYDQFADIDNGS